MADSESTCPVDDPDCLGNDGDSHDACERPAGDGPTDEPATVHIAGVRVGDQVLAVEASGAAMPDREMNAEEQGVAITLEQTPAFAAMIREALEKPLAECTLAELAQRFDDLSRSKGWYEEGTPRSIDTIIALAHSELSEAYEEYRNPAHTIGDTYTRLPDGTVLPFPAGKPYMAYIDPDGTPHVLKPEGFVVEFADELIRILQSSRELGVLEQVIEAVQRKHLYNVTRPVRHGGKRA